MRKIIQAISILILAAIVIALILPFAFRGKIDEMIKKEGNKLLNAQFDFQKLDISIFRNFPMVSVTLENFWIKGVDEFEADTLVKADGLTAGVNLFSFLGKSGYEVTNIELTNSTFNAIVLPCGKANWNILKADTINEIKKEDHRKIEEKIAVSDSTLHINLDRFVITNMNVVYDNRKADLYGSVENFNLLCSGDFSSNQTVVNLQGGASFISLQSHGVPYMSNVTLSTEMYLDADFASQKYVLKENKVCLNAITTSFGGWFTLGDSIKSMDLHLATNEISFKELLSLVPSIYTTDFEQLQTQGTAQLVASAKGDVIGDSIVPTFHLALNVENGQFQYPSLPAGIDQINIQAEVYNPGGKIDKTSVTIEPFDFRLAGNPFSLSGWIKTPQSEPEFQFNAKGTLNLGMIDQVFPLETITLNGLVSTDIHLSGLLSYLAKKQYDRVKAVGHIRVSDMQLQTNTIPDVKINKALFTFTPQYLQLSETKVIVGNSDFTLDSRFENYLGFALQNSTLKGNVNVQSKLLNLNDFMTEVSDSTTTTSSPANQKTATQQQVPTLLIVPKNIDFKMNANIDELLIKEMKLKHINGKLVVKDAKVEMSNLSLHTMGGNILMNGHYVTTNKTAPELKGALRLNEISFEQAYKELDLVKQMAPVFGGLKGHFSGSMDLETTFDAEMNPILNTLQANGKLSTRELSLSGVKVIDDIADAVGQPSLKNMKVRDMALQFDIKDGRLLTQPFDIKLGDYAITLSGSTGLDQTIDYSGKVKLPSLSKLGTIDLKIGGTFSSPTVSIDTKSMIKQATESAGDRMLQELGKKIGLDSTTTNNTDSLKGKVKEKAVEKALDLLKRL